MKKLILSLAMVLMGAVAAFGQADKFVGEWKTIDDKTNEPAGLVSIYQGEDGLYYGKLVDTFGEDKSSVGTMIVRGMKYEDGKLVGGKVYDPDADKIYYCTIKYDAAKNVLNLRGSLDKKGLLGRTQTWIK
ncbi:MAG: DUF2147 domain-containing protein [Tidjanibacter sp.]|nr:DUF2147 domain-containing protein [Tidjanibacter sp.]MBR3682575.1 DUF2147 domain-containing protein [Tidjanibacter sp.]MBR3853528.1 DUF2147 domain-containing protein [Tidjanibacter sp.]MBR7129173.1 DUF2147 domain-containing protein [Tidjanibacter sp.]